jgi:hypothetical protein
MDAHQKVLLVNAATGYYCVSRFAVGEFFGPVDLGSTSPASTTA